MINIFLNTLVIGLYIFTKKSLSHHIISICLPFPYFLPISDLHGDFSCLKQNIPNDSHGSLHRFLISLIAPGCEMCLLQNDLIAILPAFPIHSSQTNSISSMSHRNLNLAMKVS